MKNETLPNIKLIEEEFIKKSNSWSPFYSYSGNCNSKSLVAEFIKIEQLVNSLEFKRKHILFHFATELFQNISKYGYAFDGNSYGKLYIGRDNKKFIFLTGNYLQTNEEFKFKQILNHLNKNTMADLKQLYTLRLQEMKHILSSAGTGLIDIKSVCEESFDFKIIIVSNEISFIINSIIYKFL